MKAVAMLEMLESELKSAPRKISLYLTSLYDYPLRVPSILYKFKLRSLRARSFVRSFVLFLAIASYKKAGRSSSLAESSILYVFMLLLRF